MSQKQPDPARRNEQSRKAILKAAFELCTQMGYARLTIEAVAKSAGVGKQTIYRWWPSKGAVVMEALDEVVGAASDFPDTGDIVADLRQQMTTVAALISSPDFSPAYTGLIAACQSDPELARTLVNEIIAPRVAACKKRLRQAQEQGQLKRDADLDIVVELLYGGLYHRLLLRTGRPTPEQVTEILDLSFSGLRPRGAVGPDVDSG